MTPREAVLVMRRHLAQLGNTALERQIRTINAAARRLAVELRRGRGGEWQAASRASALATVRAGISTLTSQMSARLRLDLDESAERSWRDAAAYYKACDAAYLGSARALRFEALDFLAENKAKIGQARIANYSRSIARWGAEVAAVAEEAASRAAMLGRPYYDVADEITAAVRGKVKAAEWQIRRLALTETSAAYNHMQLEAMFAEDSPVDPLYKRLVAVFDKRTGRDSVILHGQMKLVREPFYDATRQLRYMVPPNRPHDREIVVGWRRSYGLAPQGGEEVARDVEVRAAPAVLPTRERPPKAGQRRARNLRPGDVLDRPGRPQIVDVRETATKIAVETDRGDILYFAFGAAIAVLVSA